MEITERFWSREESNLTPEREREIYEYADNWHWWKEFGCQKITGGLMFCCTRENGHSGPHIALGETKVFAIWD